MVNLETDEDITIEEIVEREDAKLNQRIIPR